MPVLLAEGDQLGEKDIVEGGQPRGTGGDPPPGVGSPQGGGQPHSPGTSGGDTPRTQERKDPCKELRVRAADLLQQLEGLHDQNRTQTKGALRAFFGDPQTKLAGGYAHWLQQAKITEAVVDANNAVGKALIDAALFAVGGWGGIGKMAASAGTVSKAEKVFGSGLAGSKTIVEVYEKIALKVVEKVAAEAGEKTEGKAATAGYKTVGKLLGDKPGQWYQPSMGVVESLARGAVLDALATWMKSGAMQGDLGRAATAYADFFGAAVAANVSAAAADQVVRQLRDLNAQLSALDCPEVPIPDYVFHTFTLTEFGEGAFKGQRGPTLHARSIESGLERDWDLFASVADPSGLPF